MDEDIITKTLKRKYFDLLHKEDFPHTSKTTSELDELEKEIRSRTEAVPAHAE